MLNILKKTKKLSYICLKDISKTILKYIHAKVIPIVRSLRLRSIILWPKVFSKTILKYVHANVISILRSFILNNTIKYKTYNTKGINIIYFFKKSEMWFLSRNLEIWLSSSVAKDIITFSLICTLLLGLVGTAFSVLIRLELLGPGIEHILDNTLYNSIITAHATILLFFLIISFLMITLFLSTSIGKKNKVINWIIAPIVLYLVATYLYLNIYYAILFIAYMVLVIYFFPLIFNMTYNNCFIINYFPDMIILHYSIFDCLINSTITNNIITSNYIVLLLIGLAMFIVNNIAYSKQHLSLLDRIRNLYAIFIKDPILWIAIIIVKVFFINLILNELGVLIIKESFILYYITLLSRIIFIRVLVSILLLLITKDSNIWYSSVSMDISIVISLIPMCYLYYIWIIPLVNEFIYVTVNKVSILLNKTEYILKEITSIKNSVFILLFINTLGTYINFFERTFNFKYKPGIRLMEWSVSKLNTTSNSKPMFFSTNYRNKFLFLIGTMKMFNVYKHNKFWMGLPKVNQFTLSKISGSSSPILSKALSNPYLLHYSMNVTMEKFIEHIINYKEYIYKHLNINIMLKLIVTNGEVVLSKKGNSLVVSLSNYEVNHFTSFDCKLNRYNETDFGFLANILNKNNDKDSILTLTDPLNSRYNNLTVLYNEDPNYKGKGKAVDYDGSEQNSSEQFNGSDEIENIFDSNTMLAIDRSLQDMDSEMQDTAYYAGPSNAGPSNAGPSNAGPLNTGSIEPLNVYEFNYIHNGDSIEVSETQDLCMKDEICMLEEYLGMLKIALLNVSIQNINDDNSFLFINNLITNTANDLESIKDDFNIHELDKQIKNQSKNRLYWGVNENHYLLEIQRVLTTIDWLKNLYFELHGIDLLDSTTNTPREPSPCEDNSDSSPEELSSLCEDNSDSSPEELYQQLVNFIEDYSVPFIFVGKHRFGTTSLTILDLQEKRIHRCGILGEGLLYVGTSTPKMREFMQTLKLFKNRFAFIGRNVLDSSNTEEFWETITRLFKKWNDQ